MNLVSQWRRISFRHSGEVFYFNDFIFEWDDTTLANRNEYCKYEFVPLS